ncbi:leucine carboxyl methyltransferase 1-like [Dendronephthya gigantea]|uniref:leucine carboxyl methyltransferase 1-like n=1 Tax=Dendronephthya gigantea TaxID=151771 RepID=UPI001069F137|nr:leucine carboxyl methyltransferase 1-like [Dendronephthya gigantea]
MMHSQDDGVIATNDDASICKRIRCSPKNMLILDNYIQHFAKSAEKKAPEIKRAHMKTYQAGQKKQASPGQLNQFLELTKNVCQVINLGSGFDTRYWQLKEACQSPKTFYEVDFGAVISRKCMAIRYINPKLLSLS